MHRSFGSSLYILFNAGRFTRCFLARFLNSGFWARGRLCAVSIGGENQEILLASVEKIEAGGELNCMSRGLGCDDKAAAGK